MHNLVEFYEMVALNDNSLRESEREAILRAAVALRMFRGAMESFKMNSIESEPMSEASFELAA